MVSAMVSGGRRPLRNADTSSECKGVGMPSSPRIVGPPPLIESGNLKSLKIDVQLFDSVAGIPQRVWDSLFPGAAEDWAYYRAIERCPPANFRFGVIAAMRADKVLAAAPVFRVTSTAAVTDC